MFEHINGNDHIKQYLSRLIERNAIPNLLLFAGPTNAFKHEFAESFAKKLVKTDKLPHPDIRFYLPEGKIGMHSIDSMRQLSREVYLPPYSSSNKVFIIQDAERMLPSSANAVLKTFEEPAPKSIIILISSLPEMLLPTILSRCQTARFHQSIAGKPEIELEDMSNPLRILLLNALSEGKFKSYPFLLSRVSEICKMIESSQELLGESTRESLEAPYLEGINSAQQQAIDKEIDGAMSMHQMQQAQLVFNTILSWYRDMHLLHVKGSQDLLLNTDYTKKIIDAMSRGEMRSLETVQSIMQKVRLTLERSSPLSSSMENLFLQLYS